MVIFFFKVDRIDADAFLWGFPKFNQSGVIINARAETVAEKPMFKESFLNRRCVIPAMGFYEWDKQKQKYLFTNPIDDVMYMAGIYKPYDGANRFVILTTSANESMADIHHRMPMILAQNQLQDWCHDHEHAVALLQSTHPLLNRLLEHTSQQQTLF